MANFWDWVNKQANEQPATGDELLYADALKQRTVLFLRILPQQANRSAIGLLCAEHTLYRGAFP